MTGIDRLKSSQALENFFKLGVEKGKSDMGKTCWRVKGDAEGYIEIDIQERLWSFCGKTLTWLK